MRAIVGHSVIRPFASVVGVHPGSDVIQLLDGEYNPAGRKYNYRRRELPKPSC